MSMTATLKAEKRSDTGKGAARRLRASGRIPAIVYGDGRDALSISLDAHETDQLFHHISVENTIVELDIGGQRGRVRTLIREVQGHPYRPQILHVDFYRIREGVAVELEVPIRLEGIPEGVRKEGGILEQLIHELPVKCVPAKIPDSIGVDVTGLQIGDAVHVSDLFVDEGVEVLMDVERTVCTVVAPRLVVEEEEEKPEEEVEVARIGEEERDEREPREREDEEE